jgi:hypothetical protein
MADAFTVECAGARSTSPIAPCGPRAAAPAEEVARVLNISPFLQASPKGPGYKGEARETGLPPEWPGKLGTKGRDERLRWGYGDEVSVSVPSGGAAGPLDSVLRQTGAVFSTRGGRPVAINFGSAAGELAVCVQAVGLVDRSGLSKLTIAAPSPELEWLMVRLLGRAVSPGGVLFAGGACWCRAARNRLLALSEPQVGRRQRDRLRSWSVRHEALVVRDRSCDLAALEVLGHSAKEVLRALGAYGRSGDPRAVAPFRAGAIDGIDVTWLLESERVPGPLARHQGNRAIERAGHEFGISCVGADAASRYALLERTRQSRLLGG